MDDNKLLNVFCGILADYSSSCDVAPFDGTIIIADDMAQTYKEVRGDLVESGKTNINEISNYNGLTLQPKENDGKFTIILSKDYVLETVNKQNINWVGTLVHEATHVNDFKDYFEIVCPETYDELSDYNLHRMFLYWTEFHAKVMGYYFLRKYSFPDNFKDKSHLKYIMEQELPYHINYMVQEVSATQNADRQMYVVVHFLGHLAVWQYLYPSIFDKNMIHQITNNNPWLEELYHLLIKYRTLKGIYPHFDEMKGILDKHFLNCT